MTREQYENLRTESNGKLKQIFVMENTQYKILDSIIHKEVIMEADKLTLVQYRHASYIKLKCLKQLLAIKNELFFVNQSEVLEEVVNDYVGHYDADS